MDYLHYQLKGGEVAKERDIKRLIAINPRGDTKVVHPEEDTYFTDKKTPIISEERLLSQLVEARRTYREMEVGQREGSVTLRPQYPDIPVYIWLNTDSHVGSVLTDYNAFLRDYHAVLETPNFYTVSNGDEIDNFMVTLGRVATGVYEDPITPQEQALLIHSLYKKMDKSGKLIGMSFGNHNQWLRGAGYKFENTWLRDIRCPILNCGGVLHITTGSQTYDLAMSHSHWGNSKLNPTNAAKRMLEHEYPNADICFLGHTHTKEMLHFVRGGKDRLAIIGGTYKVDDEFGAEHGMGRGGVGECGITIALYPDRRQMQAFYTVAEARESFSLQRGVKRR